MYNNEIKISNKVLRLNSVYGIIGRILNKKTQLDTQIKC
jgi:hypothetical protein